MITWWRSLRIVFIWFFFYVMWHIPCFEKKTFSSPRFLIILDSPFIVPHCGSLAAINCECDGSATDLGSRWKIDQLNGISFHLKKLTLSTTFVFTISWSYDQYRDSYFWEWFYLSPNNPAQFFLDSFSKMLIWTLC